MSLKLALQEREASKGPISIGLIGAGQMGTGLISQTELMAGMTVAAVADIVPGRSEEAFQVSGVDGGMIASVSDSPEQAADLIAAGKRVATISSALLSKIPNIDVVVEATGIPEVGAVVCQDAILNNRHIVNMNVETDATIGFYLTKLAASAGVVYSLASGDEPGSIKELYDFADALGFEIVCIGKGKNNPLDRTANPDTVAKKAEAQEMSAKMLASFVDGTKTMVEMTSIANGTGFKPEIRGAHGPKCSVEELPKVFVPSSDGGILQGKGAVDYAIGPAPGVFVIITTDHPKIAADLRYLSLTGHGDYWSLYRPYHLANLETPIAIARAVLYGEATLASPSPPVAETIAVAKKDLVAGETIDSLGGYTVYGLIERHDRARESGLLPLGLAPGAILQTDVKRGDPLRYEEVELQGDQTIVHLRALQDKLIEQDS